jgi:hypothetical protein
MNQKLQRGPSPSQSSGGMPFCNSLTLAISYGSLAARTSTFSMDGGVARSSGAFAISAAATLPERCACRPASSGNASTMPNMVGPIRMANHAVVAGSSSTSGRALRRNASISASLPGFASSFTNNATVTVFIVFSLFISKSRRTHLNTGAKSWCAIQGSNL